ncbi:MAG: hypothetical protein M3O70_13155 [Actinomycetota bacterium]|nr:hypothetical protein [Actinomycetota bacterium]
MVFIYAYHRFNYELNGMGQQDEHDVYVPPAALTTDRSATAEMSPSHSTAWWAKRQVCISTRAASATKAAGNPRGPILRRSSASSRIDWRGYRPRRPAAGHPDPSRALHYLGSPALSLQSLL